MRQRSRRGRPPLGNRGMVTIGVRVEPDERDQLQRIAEAKGLTLCALVRDLLRQNLIAGSD